MSGTSVFPGALDTTTRFPVTISDDTDSKSGADLGVSTTTGFLAQLLNDLDDAVVKIETALGVNPQGTFTNLAARQSARLSCRKTADQAFASTTLASVTDLSFAVAASLDYYFKFVVMFQSSTTTSGIALSLTGPGTPTALSAGVSFTSLTGTVATNIQTSIAAYAAKASTSSATAAATNYIAVVEGILSNGATAGTLQLTASEGGGTAASQTIKKGSYGEMYVN